MLKKIFPVIAFSFLSFLSFAVPAGAYTVGQQTPAGAAQGIPYVMLNVNGRYGYIYPNAATLELLAVGPNDRLACNLSGVGVPSYNNTGFQGTRLYTFAFYDRPGGDSQVSVLACYMMLPNSPSGAISYPCSIRWAWLTPNTNYFNGTNPQLIPGDVLVLDTNIPSFSPKNADMLMQSPERMMVYIVGVLGTVCLLFNLINQVGRFRKGASSY